MSIHQRLQQEYQDHLPLVHSIQQDLQDDVEELKAQEGWDLAQQHGVEEWVADMDSIWRALRRNQYDDERTLSHLMSALSARLSRGLHAPIPAAMPYADSPLFYFLPLPRFTDRLGRPIAVLTLREVVRAENGLEDMKDWVWWSLELTRRVLRDWWGGEEGKARRGSGGEGCVLLVDARGAGYRNLEVELLPTLLSVGHDNFPGLFEAVLVINAGWTQRHLWKIVKRLMPKSALEKVAFLDSEDEVDKVFVLDRLPKDYGGYDDFIFAPEDNRILNHYSHHSSSSGPAILAVPSRSASCVSIADVFYTAKNTPTSSRRQSVSLIRPPRELQMTRAVSSQADIPSEVELSASRPKTATPLQRIKSLSDFHLYLSPSRLAHIDLLSDSEGEEKPQSKPGPNAQSNKVPPLPALCTNRKVRPSLRLLGDSQDDGNVRSYSNSLQMHYAKVLEMYSKETNLVCRHPAPNRLTHVETVLPTAERPPVPAEAAPPATAEEKQIQPISAFSTTSNPWFGYPAIRISSTSDPSGSSIQPRYSRNRKRDLLKTLLFLFMLRVQSWRDYFERVLGLNRLGTWGNHPPEERKQVAAGPVEGLRLMRKREERKGVAEKDWIWMAVGFILLRGTWTRLLAMPLEAMGLEVVRDLLGLS
ncbi:hypothetical protein P7C73_g2557, partial [Tremellales sp. Uapishka_1]